MKKLFIGILFTIFICCGVSIFAACSGGNSGNSVDDGKKPLSDFEAYTEDIDYRFAIASDEECPNGEISDDKLYGGINLYHGKTYYVVLDCVFHNFNWAADSFTISTSICDNNGLTATLHEAATGNFDEGVENSIYKISTYHSVPQNREEERAYRIVYEVNITDGVMLTANFEIDYLGKSSPFAVGNGIDLEMNADNSSYTVKGILDNSLTSLALPSYYGEYPVNKISEEAFKGNTALEKVIIPGTVVSIGAGAFEGCVAEVGWGENSSLNEISKSAFKGYLGTSFSIPESIKSIGESAFDSCYYLSEVTFVENCKVASIGNGAFMNCTSLANITIPGNVISIGGSAFYGCTGLENLNLPESVTSIGDSAFYGCTGFESLTIPENVTSIGKNAFGGCENLASITLAFVGNGSNETHFGYIFGADTYGDNAQHVPESLKTVEITGGDSIEKSAFYECNIESLTIPFVGNGSNKTHFGYIFGADTCNDNAQYVPKSLKTVVITDGSVVRNAFYNCTSLESITISENVTFIGEDAFSDCRNLASITLPFVGDGKRETNFGFIFGANTYDTNDEFVPKSLKTVVITCGEEIGNSAFRKCKYIESITIPDGVNSIKSSAFSGCESLANINIPSSVTSIGAYAFQNCTGIKNITVADGVNSIGENAFEGCTNIESITIPDSVTSIGEGAFKNCIMLSNITLPFTGNVAKPAPYSSTAYFGYIFGVSNYDLNWFNPKMETVSITGEKIYDNAFKGCTGIKNVTFSDNMTSIGDNAFEGCVNLTEVHMPSSVKSIGYSAFEDCTSLGSVDFAGGSQLSSVGSSLFSGCTSLKTVTIPKSLVSVAYGAFSGCTGLVSVNFETGGNLTTIDENAFNGCINLKDIIVPDGVTSIGNYAFQNCTSLGSITIGKGVASIGNYAFDKCAQLASVNITDTAAWCGIDFADSVSNPLSAAHNLYYNGSPVTNLVISGEVSAIKNYAFDGCKNLESVTIPASVTSIGRWAFYGTGLKDMTLPCAFDYFGYLFGSNSYSDNSKYMPSSLKTVVVSGGENIPPNAFYNCSNLESVTIGGGVKTIGVHAFEGCSGLKNVTVGDGVTSIGDEAFYVCNGITDITISDSVDTIGSGVLGGCRSIENITLPFVGNGSDKTHFDYIFGADTPEIGYEPQSLKNVVITGGSIESFAFSGSYLESITLSDGVTSIGELAFSSCYHLKNVVIGDGVTSIGRSAFNALDKLESVIIGNGVTSIGYRAFYNCTALKEVTFKNTTGWGIQINGEPFGLKVDNSADNAGWLRSTYSNYTWTREE